MININKVALLALAIAFGTSAHAESKKIAFFSPAAQNGFNAAIFDGVAEKAAELGYTAEIFDGGWDAGAQYSQIEDVLTANQFAGMIVSPLDNVGVSGAVEQVTAAGIPIATVTFPIGPDMNTLEPQVKGLTSTVGSLPIPGATLQANLVVDFCAKIDPCNVVIMIGAKVYPFDNLRLETYESVLSAQKNIHIVAVGEGNYSPETSLNAFTDILQANSKIHVVLSNADQHLSGAEIALEAAGHEIEPLFLIGGGAADIAIKNIRSGRWDATLAYFPKTMGMIAMQEIANALEGKEVRQAIDADAEGPVQAMITKDVLDANPDFVAEWAQ